MTTQELLDYYKNLLIIQYKGIEQNEAMIEALVSLVVASQIYTEVQNSFNIETAVGVQLDVIGKYVGMSRNVFDFYGPVVMDDDQYRFTIRMKIIQNSFGSSLYDIEDFLNTFFSGSIDVYDTQLMRLDYWISSDQVPVQLAQILITQGLLPKPMGIRIGAIIYDPGDADFFGFRTYEHAAVNSHPFNDYADYQLDWPWLSYQDILEPLIEMEAENGDIITQENEDLIYYG